MRPAVTPLPPRCLMVACATLVHPSGYAVRVWLALHAVRAVQGSDAPKPLLLSFEALRDWVRPRTHSHLSQRAKAVGVRSVCLPLVPKRFPGSHGLNAAWCALAAKWAGIAAKCGVFHAQSHLAAGACASALRSERDRSLVFDVHGVDIEEALADGRLRAGSREHQRRVRMEEDATAQADWILPVSNALAERMTAGRPVHARVRVVPCVTTLPHPATPWEEVRARTRSRLGWEGAKVLLYLGGASPWQDPKRIAAAMAATIALRTDVRALILTPDVAEFTRRLDEAGIPPRLYAVESHPHDDIAGIAAAADVGFLLRDDSIVNRVSSPTKFAEYLAVGVPVVLTSSVSDFAELARSEDVGVVVSADADAKAVGTAVARLLATEDSGAHSRRERCRRVARERLDFSSILPTYREIYAGGDNSRASS